jgi:hypothetical protein
MPTILIMVINTNLWRVQSPEISIVGLAIADRRSFKGLFLSYKHHNENFCIHTFSHRKCKGRKFGLLPQDASQSHPLKWVALATTHINFDCPATHRFKYMATHRFVHLASQITRAFSPFLTLWNKSPE